MTILSLRPDPRESRQWLEQEADRLGHRKDQLGCLAGTMQAAWDLASTIQHEADVDTVALLDEVMARLDGDIGALRARADRLGEEAEELDRRAW